jgi:hypothetical protein
MLESLFRHALRGTFKSRQKAVNFLGISRMLSPARLIHLALDNLVCVGIERLLIVPAMLIATLL